MDAIKVRGAREHNLKNIDVSIPSRRLVVFTGVSGSGKSSLAFDTIYAEGQRRYVESLSSYARQFLGQLEKAEVDSISGLSPTIAIEQKANITNPRSTVGTITEVHDYLRVLYARTGALSCYRCDRGVSSRTVPQIVASVQALPPGTKLVLLAPLVRNRRGDLRPLLEGVQKAGFLRVRVDGKVVPLDDGWAFEKRARHDVDVVVDRLTVRDDMMSRLTDSVETALREGKGVAIVRRVDVEEDILFSEHSYCAHCDLAFPALTPRLFSFNSPEGMCAECNGLGNAMEPDLRKIVPDESLSVDDGAIRVWAGSTGDEGESFRKDLLVGACLQEGIDRTLPWADLSDADRKVLLYGSGKKVQIRRQRDGKENVWTFRFEGVCRSVERLWRETKSPDMRRYYAGFLAQKPCESCSGTRLGETARSVRVAGETLPEIASWPLSRLVKHFLGFDPPPEQRAIAEGILREIGSRLGFLNEVGLGYLQLDRAAASLSGGESQRIRLAGQIGSELTGVTYVLDEPSIGLHARDNQRLILALENLRDLGNSVLVVEHDEDMIRAADHIVDFGPGAGREGGEVVAQGTAAEICAGTSLTGEYLSGRRTIRVEPSKRRAQGSLDLRGAFLNNLKDVDLQLPLGMFTVVSGVSGAGKSTLINQVLRPSLKASLHDGCPTPVGCRSIAGSEHVHKLVSIDQGPIGRSPRSNPATYTKLWDEVRTVFAGTPDARMYGYKPGRFSFNVKGGRCEACAGAGVKRIEMHFLSDVFVTCPECEGKRFNESTLRVRYKGRTIADLLEMRIAEAVDFFEHHPKAHRITDMLAQVGLGYLSLGQPSTTLSGGEAQRVKLARELARMSSQHAVYLLDEPSTGLHFADVEKLLDVLQRLVDRGHTVVLIEHHLDIIRAADHVVDLGPEGGDGGGFIVAQGSPEEIAACPESYTGQFLARAANRTSRS